MGREMVEPKPSKPALPMQSEVIAKGTEQETRDPGSDWLTLKVHQSIPRAHSPLWASVSPCAHCLFGLHL